MTTTRSAGWANCTGLLHINQTGSAVLGDIKVDVEFNVEGFEGCDRQLQSLDSAATARFCSPTASDDACSDAPDQHISKGSNGAIASCAAAQIGQLCSLAEIAAACPLSCGTPVACWLSRFYGQETMFAPQQAVRLGRYIAWQASLGQAPLRRLEAGQSCAVTEVQLDEHCSLLTSGSALSACIILVRDVKACDVHEVVLQASSTLRASVLFLIGSL